MGIMPTKSIIGTLLAAGWLIARGAREDGKRARLPLAAVWPAMVSLGLTWRVSSGLKAAVACIPRGRGALGAP